MYLYEITPALRPEEVLDYLRKSQSDDPTLTVEEILARHEKHLDEWAEKNLGAKVPEENKFREVVSGETIKERPEINKILRMIESPKYRAVKVVEPQRLTRGDLEDIGRIMKLLKLTNTLVITLDRIYNLRDEYDWNAFEAELKRGNDYLKYTKKILNRGKLLSVSQGNYISSVPPYGYDKAIVTDGKKKCPTLKENKEQADVVRLIFDLYVNKDMGRKRICNYLEEMKIKPPKGKYWSPASLKEMLSNIHYMGMIKWNWRKTVEIVDEGEYIKTRPKSKIGEFLIYEGRHEGIISEELFNAAQEKQGRLHRAKATTKVRNPLVGVVFCSCGRSMIYKRYKDKDGKDRCLPRIMCPDQAHCGSGSCTFDELYEKVCLILKECIEDFEIRIQNDEGSSMKLHASLIKNLEKKLKDLQEKELAQWERQSHPDESLRMPEHIFKQLNEKLLEEKEEVQEALCKAYASMPEPVDYEEKITRFKEALDVLQDPDADAELKNKLLKTCIDKIIYKREAPQRVKHSGRITPTNTWSNPPIELDVHLRV